jgi:DNA-binding winged helix-turn-helix (wHTH) protein
MMTSCNICKGNDKDAPCAYPSECLRDQRIIAELKAERDELKQLLKIIEDVDKKGYVFGKSILLMSQQNDELIRQLAEAREEQKAIREQE